MDSEVDILQALVVATATECTDADLLELVYKLLVYYTSKGQDS